MDQDQQLNVADFRKFQCFFYFKISIKVALLYDVYKSLNLFVAYRLSLLQSQGPLGTLDALQLLPHN